MALDPGFPTPSGPAYHDDVYERIMKQQRRRKRRFYAMVWTLSILAVSVGVYYGWHLS